MKKHLGSIVALFAIALTNCQLQFHQTKETLDAITCIIKNKEKGAYLRFGDGDIFLAMGKNDQFQFSHANIATDMQAALSMNGKNILKCLPLHCEEFGGYETGMFPGNHLRSYESCLHLFNNAQKYWGLEINELYSPVALHFASTTEPESCILFLKTLKQCKHIIFVGNENIPAQIQKTLFGPNVIFIPTPAKNSYNAINAIEQSCLNNIPLDQPYTMVVTAMGCAGRILQKRLWSKRDNIFLFDFGSLMDALCGWDTRAWIKLTKDKLDLDRIISSLNQEVKILYTAALIDDQYEMRKKEYIKSLKILLAYNYEPYIVESCNSDRYTFFEDYSSHVFYTNTNNLTFHNKGVNEVRAMLASFEVNQFDDNDMIIKITGRYSFDNNSFIKAVESNPQYDAFVKYDSHGQVISGCFAMRYKYLKDMLKKIDLNYMEQKMINLERIIANYISANQKLNVYQVNTLNVTANIFGKGECALTHW